MSVLTELVHDLRLPLQAMMSCAQLLEAEVGENERARGYVRMLLDSAAEMSRMLTAELERSRPEAGAVRWTRSDLVARTWEIFTRYRLYAERKGIGLSFHANIDRLPLALDEEKFGRILSNLTSNALRYTPAGGHVRLQVRAMGDAAEVDVKDDGCGIAPERMAQIFELHATDEGYGYGLYIARQYARRMRGELTAASEPGAGSTFTLRLPVRSVEAARRGE